MKEILFETYSTGQRNSPPTPSKKKNYRSKKKKETKYNLDEELVMRAGEVVGIVKPKQAGSYKIGKSFHIFFENKPNVIHRYFTKLLLGWEWKDQK